MKNDVLRDTSTALVLLIGLRPDAVHCVTTTNDVRHSHYSQNWMSKTCHAPAARLQNRLSWLWVHHHVVAYLIGDVRHRRLIFIFTISRPCSVIKTLESFCQTAAPRIPFTTAISVIYCFRKQCGECLESDLTRQSLELKSAASEIIDQLPIPLGPAGRCRHP